MAHPAHVLYVAPLVGKGASLETKPSVLAPKHSPQAGPGGRLGDVLAPRQLQHSKISSLVFQGRLVLELSYGPGMCFIQVSAS